MQAIKPKARVSIRPLMNDFLRKMAKFWRGVVETLTPLDTIPVYPG